MFSWCKIYFLWGNKNKRPKGHNLLTWVKPPSADMQMACNIYPILLWQGNGLNIHWLWRRCLLKVFFSIFSSGRHFVQPSGAILVILVEGHWWNTSVQIFWSQAIGQGWDVVWRFSIFQLWRPSYSMEQNHCGHLGFSIGTILACFDPEVILLLQSKFRLKAI